MDDSGTPPSQEISNTLRARVIDVLRLQDHVTNTQIVDIVAGLTATTCEAVDASPEVDKLKAANSTLARALNTLSQVNRAQASMLEEVFAKQGGT